MKERFISAMIMLPLLILLLLKGIPLYIGGLVLMTIALHEFYVAFETKEYKPINLIGYVFSAILFLANVFSWDGIFISSTLFVLFIVSIFMILYNKNTPIDVMITFSGMAYICLFFEYIIMIIDDVQKGSIYVWLVFIISFVTDIFAYLIGRQFGKHKLIPKVSPKKTVEGSIGGILACFISTVIFGIIFKMPITVVLILGVFGSMVAQLGDLTASSIKRYVGIKDFGRIIPGHGGILDRFDSVLLVSPFVYLVLVIFLG